MLSVCIFSAHPDTQWDSHEFYKNFTDFIWLVYLSVSDFLPLERWVPSQPGHCRMLWSLCYLYYQVHNMLWNCCGIDYFDRKIVAFFEWNSWCFWVFFGVVVPTTPQNAELGSLSFFNPVCYQLLIFLSRILSKFFWVDFLVFLGSF